MTDQDPWDFSEFGEQSAGPSPAPGTPPGGSHPAPDGQPGGDLSAAADGSFGVPTSGARTSGTSTSPSTGRGSGALTFDELTTSTAPATSLSVAGPPLNWLGASAAAAVVGLLLAVLLGALPPLAVIGWVLAGPVAIGALAVYTSADTRRRARPLYVAPNWLPAAYYACLGVCLIGVVIAAIRIALWVGRW